MDVHCLILSTLSATDTTSKLWNAGIHVHVINDTLHKFVLQGKKTIHIYICTISPLMEAFLPVLHYHTYHAGVLYDASSAVSILRAQMCIRALTNRPIPPKVSLISQKPAETLLTNFRSIRGWLNRVRASTL